MTSIDFVYRFDPQHPEGKPTPEDGAAARRLLVEGNQLFSRWMESCRKGAGNGQAGHIIACSEREIGGPCAAGEMPKQSPFAVVVGCSDARVPPELLFGQGFNDLFVIRVAGNVMGDVCLGSLDFALKKLADSVRVVVMLGHSGCGAVAGAVDAYLEPAKYATFTPMLRTVVQRILVAVREADEGLEHAWGGDARQQAGYREALIESAVAINAAHAAFDAQQEIARSGRGEIEVVYGVYNLRNHQVCQPVNPQRPRSDGNVRLANAPTSTAEFKPLAFEMAEVLRPTFATA